MNLLTHVESYAEYYTNQEYGLLFWHRDEMNDLTYRICLSAVETKHSTLFTATGLSQEWLKVDRGNSQYVEFNTAYTNDAKGY